jgi:hypothetical protein
MPANDGVWADDSDVMQERWEDLGDGGDGPAVTRLEARSWRTSLQHDDLLAK